MSFPLPPGTRIRLLVPGEYVNALGQVAYGTISAWDTKGRKYVVLIDGWSLSVPPGAVRAIDERDPDELEAWLNG